jgi:hypothetical protein
MRIPIPREHGTWAMLYIPMLLAVVLTGVLNLKSFLFFLAVTALFFLRDPLESSARLRILRVHERRRYFDLWSSIFALIALIAGTVLIFYYRLFDLIWFASFFLAVFVAHLVLSHHKQERGIVSQLIAVVALTSTGPAMQYVVTGSVNSITWSLWILSILYFSSSVFFVKMHVRRHTQKADARSITVKCFAYHVFLVVVLTALAAYSFIPALTMIAFAPVVLRIFFSMSHNSTLNLKRIGIAEVMYTLFFAGWILTFTSLLDSF